MPFTSRRESNDGLDSHDYGPLIQIGTNLPLDELVSSLMIRSKERHTLMSREPSIIGLGVKSPMTAIIVR